MSWGTTEQDMANNPTKQAIFFELEGVLMREPRLTPDQRVTYYPGVLEAMTRIDPEQFKLFIATNRTDMAMGKLGEREFKRLCDRLLSDTRNHEIEISKIYFCPYHPKGRIKFRKESVFRKPAAGMFKIAEQEFELDLGRSWTIGHRTLDILAGQRGRLGTILVQTGEAGRDGGFQVEPHFVEPDLPSAISRITAFEHAQRI